MPTEKKIEMVKELKKLLQDRDAIITDYRGLSVSELREIRLKLKEMSVDYKIVKNTLMRIAAKDAGQEEILPFLEGPSAIAFGGDDAAQTSKALLDFAKTHKVFEIKGGLVDGSALGADQIKKIASLPPKEVLLAQLLGAFQAPIGAFVRVVAAPTQGLVNVLDRIREAKEQEAAA